jgi:hypothetical protein
VKLFEVSVSGDMWVLADTPEAAEREAARQVGEDPLTFTARLVSLAERRYVAKDRLASLPWNGTDEDIEDRTIGEIFDEMERVAKEVADQEAAKRLQEQLKV